MYESRIWQGIKEVKATILMPITAQKSPSRNSMQFKTMVSNGGRSPT